MWAVDDEGATLQVSAFGIDPLRCVGYTASDGAAARSAKAGAQLRGLFLGSDKTHAPRVAPSPALADTHVGLAATGTQQPTTEDDLLHIKSLPTFDDRLRQHESELLLSYLTVPYLRIPLVLHFFADRTRLKALASPKLQAVLDAVVFEPAAWRRYGIEMPSTIPAADRGSLSTPAGLLLNELSRAPTGVVATLGQMIDLALEMDVGRYAQASSPIVLFVLRLAARLEGYVRLLLPDATIAAAMGVGAASVAVSAFASAADDCAAFRARCVALSADKAAELRVAWAAVAAALRERAVPMLQAWVAHAIDDVNLRLACGLHAHLVLLHKNMSCDAEFSKPVITTILSAQVFINVNWVGGADGSANAIFGVCESELFDTFQRLRHPMLCWLTSHPSVCDGVMEDVVRTIRLADERRPAGGRAMRNSGDEAEKRRAILARRWLVLERPGHAGRLLPDTELATIQQALDRLMEAPTYEAYLRGQAQAVDTEVNLQLGEYTLKNHTLQALPSSIALLGDFVDVFGIFRDANPIQSVEVLNSTRRTWLRLVGQRHDVQLWDEDSRQPQSMFDRPYTEAFDPRANVEVGSAEGEGWIAAVLEPYRRQYLRECELFLPSWDHSAQSFAILSGTLTTAAPTRGEDESSTRGRASTSVAASGRRSTAMAAESGLVHTLKEVVVFRSPAVVHVYNVVEHGRRFYRTLVASSDNAFCLHDVVPCKLFLQGERPKLVAGDPRTPALPSPSLLITRSLTKQLGTQTYIPQRLLCGLLPAALLEVYSFWQNADGTLTAYPQSDSPLAVRRTRLQLTLSPQGEPDVSGMGGAQAVLTLAREVMTLEEATDDEAAVAMPRAAAQPGGGAAEADSAAAERKEEHAWMCALAEVDVGKPKLTLLNLLHAPAGSALRELADIFLRLENLSHVLAWSETPGASAEDLCSIDLVELPRLRLSFRIQSHPLRLLCVEHAGLAVSTHMDPRTASLLACVPHSLLLENAQGEHYVLVSATALPMRPFLKAALFSNEVVLDRSNPKWLRNVGNAPAYLYPLHVGKLSLGTPTFAAGLYMLLLRFLAGEYEEVFRSASCTVSDMPLSGEESQIFEQLGAISHDVHPDAHACRLKISIATRGTPHGEIASTKLWSVRAEYVAYVAKWRFVSTVCRMLDEGS